MNDEEIVVGEGKSFDRELPPAGPVSAVVWRVFNVGLQPGYKSGEPSAKLVIYYEIAHRYQTGEYKGKRFLKPQLYFAGLGGKSYLRRDVQFILNRELTDAETKGFAIRKGLEGKACLLMLMHEKSKDGLSVYANIKGVMGLPEDMAPLVAETPLDYVPAYIEKLMQTRVVQENIDLDRIADKGFKKDESPTDERARLELEIGKFAKLLGADSEVAARAHLKELREKVTTGGLSYNDYMAQLKNFRDEISAKAMSEGLF